VQRPVRAYRFQRERPERRRLVGDVADKRAEAEAGEDGALVGVRQDDGEVLRVLCVEPLGEAAGGDVRGGVAPPTVVLARVSDHVRLAKDLFKLREGGF
jgi:hypothetical protein